MAFIYRMRFLNAFGQQRIWIYMDISVSSKKLPFVSIHVKKMHSVFVLVLRVAHVPNRNKSRSFRAVGPAASPSRTTSKFTAPFLPI